MFSFITKNYAGSSDEELMELIIKGNEKAFGEVYKRYSKSMLYFFYQRLNKEDDKAQDFLQDLFLKVIEKADQFDPDKKLKIWLYSIAVNMCKNEYRRAAVRGIKVNDFNLNELSEVVPVSVLLDKFDRDLFNKTLNDELQALEESQNLTFILRYKEHLSIKEISEVMECAEGTVKSRLFYTIKKLSQKLKIFNPYKEVNEAGTGKRA